MCYKIKLIIERTRKKKEKIIETHFLYVISWREKKNHIYNPKNTTQRLQIVNTNSKINHMNNFRKSMDNQLFITH